MTATRGSAFAHGTGNSFGDEAMPPAAAGGGDRCSGPGFATCTPVLARHGMAATAQPSTTMIAVEILKKAALGLMEPVSCGIGGDPRN
jgi:gamma-glutamyltranspeptidase / glutathione hydrolase